MSGKLRVGIKAMGLCLDCGQRAGGQWLRCFLCRQKDLTLREGFEAVPESPYRGRRQCSQQLSANCTQTFLSPDKRAIHCCPACRHVQLQMSQEGMGE